MLFKRRRTPEQRKHVAGLVRMLGYFAGVGVVCGALSVRAARAEVGDQAIVVGRQMAMLANTMNTDVTQVRMNGQPMFVGSSLSKEPVKEVLERYEALCEKNGAQAPETWRELGSKGAAGAGADKNPATDQLTTSGLIRSGGEDEGSVLCFVKGSQSKPTAMEAFKTFGATGELGAIGELRYVFARKTEQGNTHVLTGWTTSKFNLKDMVSEGDVDVAGEDFAGIPRPENARRVLSARIEGSPFGVNSYTTDSAPNEVAAFYDQAMIKDGWFALDAEVATHMTDGNPKKVVGHLYEKDSVVLTLAAHVDDGKTFATLGLAGVAPGKSANR